MDAKANDAHVINETKQNKCYFRFDRFFFVSPTFANAQKRLVCDMRKDWIWLEAHLQGQFQQHNYVQLSCDQVQKTKKAA